VNELSWNRYGKSRVRLVKVKRTAEPHAIVDLTLDIQLEGAFDRVYIEGDNGTSAEGGPYGSVNEHRFVHGLDEDLDENLARIDDLGGLRARLGHHLPGPGDAERVDDVVGHGRGHDLTAQTVSAVEQEFMSTGQARLFRHLVKDIFAAEECVRYDPWTHISQNYELDGGV
jgi:hypothetical protein